MKRYKLLVSSPAVADIDAAYRYIRLDSAANAAMWRKGLGAATRTLRTFPRGCRLAPENGRFELEIRQLLYGNYRILFTIRGDAVIILHVRHAAQQELESFEIVPPDDE